MTLDDPADVLTNLIRCVPVHVVDLQAAHRTRDHVAIAYAKAISRWQAEAREALAEARQGNPAHPHHEAPDAFARAASASALMRQPAAE